MSRIRLLILMAAAAFALTGCEPAAYNANTSNTANANANANAAKPVAAAPTKESLMAIEKSGWEAWMNKDAKAFEELLSSRYVGFGPAGRLDKASAITSLTNPKCEVKSYSLSDDQLNMIGNDVAVLSFKGAQDGTCDGTKLPANLWASAVYVREGDNWRAVYYSENAATDPKAAPAKPAAPAAEIKPEGEAQSDALTTALTAVEADAWDAWKNRDAKAMGDLTTSGFLYVSGSGRQDKAAALKGWSEPKCEGLSYVHSDPEAVSLAPDVALVTYKADVKGTCDVRPVPPSVWVASFNQKEGDTWKNAFYTDVPR